MIGPRSLGKTIPIPFNKPYLTGREERYLRAVLAEGRFTARGAYTRRCEDWLVKTIGCQAALLTHSASAALEIAVILADVGPGDEVIMPSFTFPSMANAVVLRGGVPVFVDIRADTLNLDERLIEPAISSRSKAVMPMHYGGVACEMTVIQDIATRHGLQVIEDAAHALLANYRGRGLGAIGHTAAISFHETKNIMCGEGGAILVNEPNLVQRSEILLEKGTNRSAFLRGEVGKYHWLDLGSSYGASELTAGFLWAQFEAAEEITRRRRAIWARYHACLEALEVAGKLRRPSIPDYAEPNGHLYYVLIEAPARRDQVMDRLMAEQIIAPIHYVPLHSAPAGRRYGRIAGPMDKTEDLANRLIRLPLWLGMEDRVEEVVGRLEEAL